MEPGPDVQATSTYQKRMKTEVKWFVVNANVMFCNTIMLDRPFCLLVKLACKNPLQRCHFKSATSSCW
jgi:hypothetical protein